MTDLTMPRLRAAIPFCMALLLAACGTQASDEDTRKLADPTSVPATAAVPGAGGGAHEGSADASTGAGNGASLAQQGSGDEGDDSGDGSGSDWPSVREIPAGVLTWTVVYKGTGSTQTKELKEVAVLYRKVQGKAHMVGAAGNPDEAPPATPLDGINKAMEACGDDMACQQKAAMKAMALARKDPDALERGMRDAMAEAQRDTVWGADSCSAVGEADDKATWSGMTPLGFSTGEGTRQGKRAMEDCTGSEAPRLVADENSKTYTLTLPAGEIRVEGKLGGRVDPVPRIVEFPQLRIARNRYARLDRPLTGSATVHMGRGHGVWSEGWDMPLTETVSWTFTPDPR